MALTAVFAADFDRFERSIQDATVKLQVFDRATRDASRRLTRELESISGQRVAAEAARMAEAVRRLGGDLGVAGGLAKLLPEELRRVSATLEQAAQKAALLGEELPPSLKQMREEIAKLPKPTTDASTRVGGLTSAFQQLASRAGPVGPLLQGVVAGGVAAVGTAAIQAAAQLVEMAVRGFGTLIERGGRMAGLRDGFVALSGGVGEATAQLRQMQSVSRGLVDGMSLIESANRAMLLGVTDNAQQMGQLAQTAVILGRAMGQDATKSINDLVTALGRVSPMILDNLGLSVRVGEANEKYAAAIGKTAAELTEAERKQAFMNAALDAAAERVAELGGLQLRVADRLRQVSAAWSDLTAAIGEFLNESPPVNAALESVVVSLRTWEALLRGGAGEALREYRRQIGELPPDVAHLDGALKKLVPTYGSVALAADEMSRIERELTVRVQEQIQAADAYAKALDQLTGRKALADAQEALRLLAGAGGPGGVLPSQLEALARTFDQAAAAAMHLGRIDLATQYRQLARTLDPVVQFQQRWNVTIGEFLTTNPDYTQAILQQNAALQEQAEVIAFGILPNLLDLSKAWEQFAQVAPDPSQTRWEWISEGIQQELTETAKRIPMTLARALESGGGIRNALRSIGAQIGADIGEGIGQAVGGEAGAIVGEAAGSIAGALIGNLIGAIGRSPAEDVMRRIGHDWGVQISEGLAESIAQLAEQRFRGDRTAAEIFSLDRIIGEAGGLDPTNIERFTRRLRDVFSMIETGQFSVAEGALVLEHNWRQFADVGTDATGRLSDGLREIILLAREAGVETRALTEYVQEQASTAIDAFAAIADGLTAPWRALGEEVEETTRALADFDVASGSAAELFDLMQRHEDVLARQAEEAARARDALADLGMIAVASYGAAIQSGMSHAQALRAAGPGLANLVDAYESLGLSIEDAGLASLALQHRIAEQNPTLIAGIEGLSQSFISLHNIGLLNVDTFQAMLRTGHEMYTRLQGATAEFGGTTRDALLPMQDFLREAARQARMLGVPLDENTAILIEQSKELGIWQEQGRSANERLLDGIEDLTDALHEVARIFGESLPQNARRAADAIAREFRHQALPALQDTADAVRDIIEERSPTGLEGIETYAGYAADALVDLSRRAGPELDEVAEATARIAERLERAGSTAVVRGLQNALRALRDIQRQDLEDAVDFGLAKFQGSAGLSGRLQSLQREVLLLQLKDLPREVRQLAHQMQDEILGLGPDPVVYRQQWERATEILRSSLRFQLEDLEIARAEAIRALGLIPAEYEREFHRAAETLDRDHAKRVRQIEEDLQKLLRNPNEATKRFARDLGITQAEALEILKARNREMLREEEERFARERERLGLTPDEYREAYEAAVRAINEQYDQMARRAQERAELEIQQLGLLPDEYERQYDEIVQLVGQKYALMAEAAAEAAKETIDAWSLVVDWYRQHFRYLPSGVTLPGVPGAPGPGSGGGGATGFTIDDAIAQAQAFAEQHLNRRLLESELQALAARFTGDLTRENVQRFLEAALAQARAGQGFAEGGLVGPRPTDTVPAMLTPGELVLNRATAERVARGDWPGSSALQAELRAMRTELAAVRADAGRRDADLPHKLANALDDVLARRRRVL